MYLSKRQLDVISWCPGERSRLKIKDKFGTCQHTFDVLCLKEITYIVGVDREKKGTTLTNFEMTGKGRGTSKRNRESRKESTVSQKPSKENVSRKRESSKLSNVTG